MGFYLEMVTFKALSFLLHVFTFHCMVLGIYWRLNKYYHLHLHKISHCTQLLVGSLSQSAFLPSNHLQVTFDLKSHLLPLILQDRSPEQSMRLISTSQMCLDSYKKKLDDFHFINCEIAFYSSSMN